MKKTTKKTAKNVHDIGDFSEGIISTYDFIETLLRAIVEKYPDDTTKPGLVLSYVGTDRTAPDDTYYGSVCRYPNGIKIVAHGAYAETAMEVLEKLAACVAALDNTARTKLRSFLP